MEDFEHLIKAAEALELKIAMDLAFQCSLDHPYLTEHPEWFKWRPDGSIQYAENPPKKYEDIVSFDFDAENWQELWNELLSIPLFWIEKGIKIFRVDNPHTKPFPFWEWLINEIKRRYPEVIFLCEAFTRPSVMYWLSKLGFTQSYTYFAWRHTKRELIDYMNELTATEVAEYMRPNFWPNTPDILTEELQHGGWGAFASRLILAATLSSNYGIYGPPFEFMINEAIPGGEEYLHSEKYEIKKWDFNHTTDLRKLIILINRIRKSNPALHETRFINFHEIDNEQIIYYIKTSSRVSNTLLVLVNLDPYHTQTGSFKVPLKELDLKPEESFRVHELITDRYHIWEGEKQKVTLDPAQIPARIFQIQKKIHRENDFDYFM